MDKYQQLFERVDASMEERRTTWVKLSPDVLVEQAKEIAALQDTHEYLAQGRGIDPNDVDYLLSLEDPLQSMADHWLKRMDDLSDFSFALDDLCRHRNAPVRQSVLAQLHKQTVEKPSRLGVPTKEKEER